MAEAVAININHFLFYYLLLYYRAIIYIYYRTNVTLTKFKNKQPMCNIAKFIFY